jgi:hypothetical protein
MKKLLFAAALAVSSLTFANTTTGNKEIKEEVKHEQKSTNKELTKEQKEKLAMFFRWWSVSYGNACGTTNTVYFQSDNPDGSAGFIDELAYAVNSSYYTC